MPDEYQGVEYDQPEKANQTKPSVPGTGGHDDLGKLRKKLAEGPQRQRPAKPNDERMAEALAARLAISGTRRTLDGISFVAYTALGLDLVLGLVGQRSMIQMIWWLPHAFRYPIELLLGLVRPGLVLDQTRADILALVIWGAVHLTLRAIHRKLTIERMALPR